MVGEDARGSVDCKAEEECLTGGEADDDNAADGLAAPAAASTEFGKTA